jgi:hypothetical protein
MNSILMGKGLTVLGITGSLVRLKEEQYHELPHESNGKEGCNDFFKVFYGNLVADAENPIDQFRRSGIQDRKHLFGITECTAIQNNSIDHQGHHNNAKGANNIDICTKKECYTCRSNKKAMDYQAY